MKKFYDENSFRAMIIDIINNILSTFFFKIESIFCSEEEKYIAQITVVDFDGKEGRLFIANHKDNKSKIFVVFSKEKNFIFSDEIKKSVKNAIMILNKRGT